MRASCLVFALLTICAQQALASPSLQLQPVQAYYLPGSDVTLKATAQEIEQIHLAVYRVDPFQQFQPARASSMLDWVSQLHLGRMAPVLTRLVRPPRPPFYASSDIVLGKLPAGAYVVEASAGDLRARSLVVVTGMMVITRSVGSQSLIYVCNAGNGAPIAGAALRVITGRRQPHELRLRTDRQGVALCPPDTGVLRGVLASAGKWQAYTRTGDRTDIVIIDGEGASKGAETWRFYLFTDLPVYQPGQTVNWRLIARWWDKDTYRTPAEHPLRYTVIGPGEERIGSGEIKLNAFGSACGAIEIPEKAQPGRYYLRLNDERGREIRTLLFCRVGAVPARLQVSLQANLIPGQADERGAYSPDSVQVRVRVTDRSGKPVSGARVRVNLFASNLLSGEPDVRDMPWYFEGTSYRGLPGLVSWASSDDSAEATTDAQGTATVTVSREKGAFFGEYRVWATAETGQGGLGAGFIRVLALGGRGWAYITMEKGAYKPGETVTFRLHTLGADASPTAMRGVLHLLRATNARDVWKTPWNTDVRDEEIARRLHELGVPLERAETDLTYEEVLSQPVHTDASGRASVRWKPDREGYYEVRWEQEGVDTSRRAIAGHSLYVVQPGSQGEIHARVEWAPVAVFPTQSDIAPGQSLPVLVFVQNPPRHVLLLEEGRHILRWHLVHAKRKVEMIYLPVTEQHTPVFTLSGVVVEDGQAFGFAWNVVVPPRQHNLRIQLQPGTDGLWTVRTTDEQGKPVPADVSVALVNRASLASVLRFPTPWFDGARTSDERYVSAPPLPPGYPEDPRLYFTLPVPFSEPSRFDTSYDVAPYFKMVRAYQMLPIPYNWRYMATEWGIRPGGEMPKPPGLISGGEISQSYRDYGKPSLPKGVPEQVDESSYARLPYTRYVQQALRDAVLAHLPDDGEDAPRTLFWLPRVVTDEKGSATFSLPAGISKGGVLIAIGCSEGSRFGWWMQAITTR